jgi:hypothetical protein
MTEPVEMAKGEFGGTLMVEYDVRDARQSGVAGDRDGR